jgi:hypothetical protein
MKKILGIALGERSLLAAEVVAGEKPRVTRLAELVYPEAISLSQPVELAKVLVHFLKDNQFSTRSAIIGIPLKWVVVRTKEVPPADDATIVQLLRMESEAEFSADLKDLVYDFSRAAATDGGRTVLLTATSRKYIDSIQALCEGARLVPMAVTPSAMTLGSLTGSALKRDVLVLSVTAGGSELSSQRNSSATAIRSLRPANPEPPFVSELRRAVSTLSVGGADQEMVLWDGAGVNASELGRQIGVQVRSGDLHALGVDTAEAGANGEGAKYAAAVALALSALDGARPSVDFLHSRLAPPREHRIPRWAYFAAAACVLFLGICIYAYSDLEHHQKTVSGLEAQISQQQSSVDAARDFVSKVSLAEYWHIGEARYLACLRDLDDVIPEDGQTYATSLEIKAQTPPVNSGAAASPSSAPPPPANSEQARTLQVTLQGHTANLESVTALADRMRHNPTAFKNIAIGPETKVPRTQEFLFSITFSYVPSKPADTSGGQTK